MIYAVQKTRKIILKSTISLRLFNTIFYLYYSKLWRKNKHKKRSQCSGICTINKDVLGSIKKERSIRWLQKKMSKAMLWRKKRNLDFFFVIASKIVLILTQILKGRFDNISFFVKIVQSKALLNTLFVDNCKWYDADLANSIELVCKYDL